METIFSVEHLLALVTLTVMEIVLGVDNIIFISILAGKLPLYQQRPARQIGLSLALDHAPALVAIDQLDCRSDSAAVRAWAMACNGA